MDYVFVRSVCCDDKVLQGGTQREREYTCKGCGKKIGLHQMYRNEAERETIKNGGLQ